MDAGMRIAIAQCPGDLPPGQARLGWLETLLAGQEGEPPDLVILPELFQSGYNAGAAIRERAEPVGGVFSQAMAGIARRFGVALIYGFAERDGGALFNAAQCFDAGGQPLALHRKLILPPGFEGDHFAPGTQATLFDLHGLKVALLICYDVEFPENLRRMAELGADLVVVPTALGAQWGVVAERVVPTRAFENGMHVAYANYCGSEAGMTYLGRSCVVAPNGQDLVRAGAEPGLFTARISRAAVEQAQARLPYLYDRQRLPW